jgi:glycine betaine/proline transport system permease protein
MHHRRRRALGWLALAAATLVLAFTDKDWLEAAGFDWAVDYPSRWELPLAKAVSGAMAWLLEDAAIGSVGFTDVTRGIAWAIEQPYRLALALLSTGFGGGATGGAVVPALSWLAVTAGVAALGHYARDWLLAAIVGACFLYLALFGQWESAMVTLASVLIAVPIGAGGGLVLGILAYRHPRFDRALVPVLDLMQTIPIFAYLVPVLFLLGFGPVSALVATVIYAMPPMVRVTTLALRSVDPEIRDFGVMAGCTRGQMTWRILVPSARESLMLGVNQVIMLSLNMVIIASMIGAGGLGFDVLTSLRRLDIGGGFEAGIAIVVLAVAIDRLSQALARRRPAATRQTRPPSILLRYPRSAIVLAIVIATALAGELAPALHAFPADWEVTTGAFWNDAISYINVRFFDDLEAVKLFILTWLLLPIRQFLLGLPWPWAMLLVALIAWKAGGEAPAAGCLAMAAFILVTGMWEKAMITVYLCGAAVLLAMVIGFPIGLLAGISPAASRAIGVVLDTLQTLPSFVYLIPVVMLFRVGDFTALVAIVLYALAPIVRYTAHGLRSVSPELIEAGVVAGCTRGQILLRIRLPLALPEILLGINQTIMLAISMVVITALVGTRDLGQEVYIALTKADTGRGIVAGLAVAFIAIIADRIVTAGARRARLRFSAGVTV